MKSVKNICLVLTAMCMVAVTACSKSSDKPPGNSGSGTSIIKGYWFGSANGGAFNQSFLFYSDGTLKVYDFYANATSHDTTQAYDGIGTYVYDSIAKSITVNTSFPNGQKFSSTAKVNTGVNPMTMTFPPSSDGYSSDVYTKQ